MATSSLDEFYALLNKGKQTSTSGGTTTESTQIDQKTLDALLKQALEGNQGLAAISSGQSGAGLYNSSTNRLLTNDLLARVATDVAAKTATSTRTVSPQTTTVNNQSMTDKDYAGLIAGTVGKGYADKYLKSKTPIKTLYDDVKGAFTTNPSADTAANNVASSNPVTGGNYNTSGITTSDLGSAVPTAMQQAAEAQYTYDAAASASTPTVSQSSPDFVGPSSDLAAGNAAANVASNSAYTGTADELAADGLGGVDMGTSSSSDGGSIVSAVTGGMAGYAVGKNNSKTDPNMTSGEDEYGKYHKDYRAEVGGTTVGALLGYEGGALGSSAAAPVVDAIHPFMQDTTRDVINFGDNWGGATGALIMDPAGATASGKYSNSEIAQAPLEATDPLGYNIVQSISDFFGW